MIFVALNVHYPLAKRYLLVQHELITYQQFEYAYDYLNICITLFFFLRITSLFDGTNNTKRRGNNVHIN